MKILLLADSQSPHTIKWVRALAGADIQVLVAGLRPANAALYQEYPQVQVEYLGVTAGVGRPAFRALDKLSYLKALPALKRFIRDFKPDILHAHYASSYGLLGALSGFTPYFVSVWGSDVYAFPKKSWLHAAVLKFALKRASRIFSTSRHMTAEVSQYTTRPLHTVPFGVDTEQFIPVTRSSLGGAELVIGTVKTMEPHYGIEYLIRAFALLREQLPEQPLRLLIVGGGPQLGQLQQLATELGLETCCEFTGRVPYQQVIAYHQRLDICVVPSLRESFGVAVLEASSCAKPVIASKVDGLPEVVEHQQTGFLVGAKDVQALAQRLNQLCQDNELRQQMGANGRAMVMRRYHWPEQVQQMIQHYQQALAANQKEPHGLA